MFGVALGAFGELDETRGNDPNPVVSGTYEIPLTREGRFRIEAGRTVLPIVPYGADDARQRTDTAHISRINVGVEGLRSPGAPLSGYLGIGYGVYRASFDHASGSGWHGGVHFYGGGEMLLSDHLCIDAEIGVHLLREPLYPRFVLPGEAVIRVKVGL